MGSNSARGKDSKLCTALSSRDGLLHCLLLREVLLFRLRYEMSNCSRSHASAGLCRQSRFCITEWLGLAGSALLFLW